MNKIQTYFHRFLTDGNNEDTLRELVQEHYSKIYLTTSIAFFGLALVGHINWLVGSEIQKAHISIWIIFVFVLTIIRLILVSKFNRHMAILDDNDKLLNPYPWAKWEVFCCTYFGAIVGGLFFIMYQGALMDNFANAQVSTMMVAMAIAISSFLAVYLPCYIGFAAASTLPVFVKVLIGIDFTGAIGLTLYVIFQVAVYRFLRTLNRKLSEPIELRLQNIELIENLARNNDAIRDYNEDLLEVLSSTSSSLKTNYLRLISATQSADGSDNGLMLNDDSARAIIELENISLLNSCVVDIATEYRSVCHGSVSLKDALDRLPPRLQKLASDRGVGFECSSDSVVADTYIFDLILRCLVVNILNLEGANDVVLQLFSDRQGECKFIAIDTYNNNGDAGYLHDNLLLMQRLAQASGLSLTIVNESKIGMGYCIKEEV